MKITILLAIVLASLLAACGDKETTATTPASTTQPATMGASNTALPADAPVVGTLINSLIKPPDTELAKFKAQDAEYKELAWEDLELPGQGLADIMKKYQPQLDAIPQGSSEDDLANNPMMEKMQSELNNAPINAALNGKKIKIPGFISPLEVDEKQGMVKEFLLVPYFGACIHVPPPPLNQTLLVKPLEGKGIGMERMYEPVWIYGTITTEQVHTDLAEAGYQIKDARVEIWQDDSKPAPTAKVTN